MTWRVASVTGDEPAGGGGDGEFLVGRDDEDGGEGVFRTDAAGGAGAVGGIQGGVEGGAERAEAGDRFAADERGVFADATGENDRLGRSAEGGAEAAEFAGEAEGEEIDGKPGGGIAGAVEFGEVAHVIDPGDAGEAGAVVEEVGDFIERHARAALEVGVEVGVDVAAAGAHDEAFERGEAHGGVHRAAIEHGGGAAAVAEVGCEDAVVVRGQAEDFDGAGGDPGVAGAVEAVAADAVIAMKLGRQGVVVDFRRDRLVEGGIEDRDLRDAGENRGGGLDAGGVGDGVGWSQRGEIDDFVEDLRGDACGGGKEVAAVDDAVADGFDFQRGEIGVAAEGIEHGGEGAGVAGTGRDVQRDAGLAGDFQRAGGIGRADAFDDAFGGGAIAGEEGEFHRGGAAVDDEDDHALVSQAGRGGGSTAMMESRGFREIPHSLRASSW